jgi:dTDP-4-dehydrorhamnose 3,5-epimerase
MADFNFEKLDLDGAFLVDNFYAGDSRGGFSKYFEKNIFAYYGIEFKLSETLYSMSSKNVIRGLHFQTNNPQAKLVTVVKGKAWDVIVDLRPDSPTYKKWIGVELSSDNHKTLYVPRGYAHGFASLEDDTIMLYLCDGAYDKESDTGVLYNAPELGIVWPVADEMAIHSDRDMRLMSMKEYERKPMNVIYKKMEE